MLPHKKEMKITYSHFFHSGWFLPFSVFFPNNQGIHITCCPAPCSAAGCHLDLHQDSCIYNLKKSLYYLMMNRLCSTFLRGRGHLSNSQDMKIESMLSCNANSHIIYHWKDTEEENTLMQSIFD
jgi:hypothetical protein